MMKPGAAVPIVDAYHASIWKSCADRPSSAYTCRRTWAAMQAAYIDCRHVRPAVCSILLDHVERNGTHRGVLRLPSACVLFCVVDGLARFDEEALTVTRASRAVSERN